MNKKGFTLIELLAVIVILAIIALIATPIILGIIRDSQENSALRSVEGYGSAVETAALLWMTQNADEGVPVICLDGGRIGPAAGDCDVQATEAARDLGCANNVTYGGAAVRCTTGNFDADTGALELTGCRVGDIGMIEWSSQDGADFDGASPAGNRRGRVNP